MNIIEQLDKFIVYSSCILENKKNNTALIDQLLTNEQIAQGNPNNDKRSAAIRELEILNRKMLNINESIDNAKLSWKSNEDKQKIIVDKLSEHDITMLNIAEVLNKFVNDKVSSGMTVEHEGMNVKVNFTPVKCITTCEECGRSMGEVIYVFNTDGKRSTITLSIIHKLIDHLIYSGDSKILSDMIKLLYPGVDFPEIEF